MMPIFDVGRKYRRLLILESKDWLAACRDQYDPAVDLVLTYDFGLKLEVEGLGGQVAYVDHMVERDVMQENNFLIYKFFRDWHLGSQGKDIFSHRDVDFGFAFRIEIWNDFVFHIRTRLCLERLREIEYGALFAGTQLALVESTLKEMGLLFTPIRLDVPTSHASYYFPIHRWLDERLRTRRIKHRFRDFYNAIHGTLMSWLDRLPWMRSKPAIFIQEYYPTREILQRLKHDRRVRVVQVHYSWAPGWLKYLTERTIPVWGKAQDFREIADGLMQNLRIKRCARLILTNGVDITDSLYRVIERRISGRIEEVIRTLDCVVNYVEKHPITLEILIANIGLVSTSMDCVCKTRGIPSYLIINGFMGGGYLDEGKYATSINCYSSSIKENYFREMSNVVCLGDPRMDGYMRNASQRQINRNTPTVTIGASGHSPIDLNSYLAVEFDFMYDILQALALIKEREVHIHVIIKIRGNGYRAQYQAFVNEYFPGVVDEILDVTPMGQVLKKTDFFISIYSQTLFEASCLGIPCLYYKKDNQVVDPPFDGMSELVTVDCMDGLINAIEDFRAEDNRFSDFMRKSVMEKYIGPLDGRNLGRNMRYIYNLLKLSPPAYLCGTDDDRHSGSILST